MDFLRSNSKAPGLALGALCGLTAPDLAFPRSDGSEAQTSEKKGPWWGICKIRTRRYQ